MFVRLLLVSPGLVEDQPFCVRSIPQASGGTCRDVADETSKTVEIALISEDIVLDKRKKVFCGSPKPKRQNKRKKKEMQHRNGDTKPLFPVCDSVWQKVVEPAHCEQRTMLKLFV